MQFIKVMKVLMFSIFKSFYSFKVRIQTTQLNIGPNLGRQMEQLKGVWLNKDPIQKVSFTPWTKDCSLLLIKSSILEGMGDLWGLGFGPLASLMCPSGIWSS